MVASMESAPLPALDPTQAKPAADSDDAASAGALLKRAFDYFKQDKNAMAAATFRAAVNTGNLNDAGRALAYWHIYVAEESIGDTDRGVDALASFVVVAQDVIEMREQMRYAEDDSGDFVDRFDLKRRLTRARAMMSVAWAAHANEFGRSEGQPVPVHSLAEKNYFLEMAPPCGHSSKGTAAASPTSAGVEQVNLTCDGGERTSYYFQVVQDD